MNNVKIDVSHYTYRVSWSPEDAEFVGTCVEFPSLSWLADSPTAALGGIEQVVLGVTKDLAASGEEVPVPLAERQYSGKFQVRVSRDLHRRLAALAAEQGMSLNRFVEEQLAAAR
jgi:predicted HicB family RNase H-like nuclease